ncbi:MAG TPA: N-acetylmuramoyl-L-alanine amidase [Bacteroidales bacterium]|nr:N-acetylmuramoyl-L-alanine amidase [Bacteroidales bacterium]
MKTFYKIFTILVLFFVGSFVAVHAQKKFTVVLDAGHGGHDSGAVGRFSREKNINLAVVLRLGELISQNHPDVKVIYTRKTDVFLTLDRRSQIANKNNADLFISIHTNATKSRSVYGTETFVMGNHKTESNLEVAMMENSVITLEDDYKTTYQGFDPKSIDSYIMFEFMQDRYLDKSLQMADLIETQFKSIKRYSRGVKQAGFMVLHRTAAPSVLVELGFISNADEERYLNSTEGKEQLTQSIYKAFANYKRKHDSRTEANNEVPVIEPEYKAEDTSFQVDSDKVIFKIQLFALERRISPDHKEFKGLKNIDYYREGGLYKYTYGEEDSFEKIENLRKSIASGFPGAYIIAFKGEKKITIGEALKK